MNDITFFLYLSLFQDIILLIFIANFLFNGVWDFLSALGYTFLPDFISYQSGELKQDAAQTGKLTSSQLSDDLLFVGVLMSYWPVGLSFCPVRPIYPACSRLTPSENLSA